MTSPSLLKQRDIIDALRMGAVPARGLELFAVGLEKFDKAIDDELASVATGKGRFKAVRGGYGSGKTFFSRWLEHKARQRDFATTLVQISETETPLYKMETIYRRALEGLQTREGGEGAFRSLIDRWFYRLEEAVLEAGGIDVNDEAVVAERVGALLEERLRIVSATQPQFAAALRACHAARVRGDEATAEGLIAWLMGQPNVGAGVLRHANLKGNLDNDSAAGFFRGLLEVLRQTGRAGLVLVLDEVETIQRVRTESREKSLNALRQFIDDLANEQYPGLYLLITGTPEFFTGRQGVKRAAALDSRLHVDFDEDDRFDNVRAVQIRLSGFTLEKLVTVGRRVRDLYPADHVDRVKAKADDELLGRLAETVTGSLGKKVGIAPRLFLRKLVDVLDKVDQHEEYDPKVHAKLAVSAAEMNAAEREAAGLQPSVEDLQLDLASSKGDLE